MCPAAAAASTVARVVAPWVPEVIVNVSLALPVIVTTLPSRFISSTITPLLNVTAEAVASTPVPPIQSGTSVVI